MPAWKGLFEWSMRYQDGTGPALRPRELTEADQLWLTEALKSAMVDFGDRLQDITAELAGGPEIGADVLAEKEQLLDELMEIVENIDQARDLHTVGGLSALLGLLDAQHATLRWRAAEVIATCAQNNPHVQLAFVEDGVLPRLLPLLGDDHPAVRAKGLLALSCSVRGCPEALDWLRAQGGVGRLAQLLGQPEPRQQRKCLQLLTYVLHEAPADRAAACADPGLLRTLAQCTGDDDNDLREAALRCVGELAADAGCLRAMQQAPEVLGALQVAQVRLDTLPREDWESVQDEVQLLRTLVARLSSPAPEPEPEPAEAAATGGAAAVAAGGAATAHLQIMAVPLPPQEPQQQ